MKATLPIQLFAASVLLSSMLVACGDEGVGGNSQNQNTADAGDTQDSGGSDNNGGALADVGVEFEGVEQCDSDDDCDDGLACTTDSCVDTENVGKICNWELAPGTCLINNRCYTNGEASDNNACAVCDATADVSGFSTLSDDTMCDDGNACTSGETCSGGVCGGGEAVTCEAGSTCAANTCDPELGCVEVPIAEGQACGGADLCTVGGTCTGGTCEGGEDKDCDDDNPCTDDSCDPETGACVHTNNTAPCEDGDLCTVDSVCSDGVCGGGVANTCDDGNQCTIDTCFPETGCVNLPTNNPCCSGAVSVCEDNNPCTTDICDPSTAECTYENNTETCDDGNQCTVNDVCSDGVCGGADRSCDDGNVCTDDSCNTSVGCVNTALDAGSCDDGLSCSTGDVCSAGQCVADTSGCLCTPTLEDGTKVVTIAVGANRNEGEAIDIDGDDERDNALGPLGGFLNEPLQGAVTDGSLMLAFEFLDRAGSDLTVAVHTAELDPGNAGCDFQSATCDYLVERSGLNSDTCDRLIALPGNLTGMRLTGSGAALPFSIPLGDGTLDITIYRVTFDMTVTFSQAGEIIAVDGLLGGAITEAELTAAILSLDPDSLPIAPDALIGLLGTLAPNDIDIDGNGTDEAKSISLKLGGIDANLVGAAAP